MTDYEVTLGEIYRTVRRLEAVLEGVQGSVEHIPTLVLRVSAVEDDVVELKTDMKTVRRDAAVMSGGIGVAAFLASIWPFGSK